MPRPRIAITNYNRQGKITPGQWYVRIGLEARTFTDEQWATEGIAWINSRLGASE